MLGWFAMQQPGVESAVAFPGLSINGFTNSSSAGIVFSTLKPFGERKDPSLSANAIAAELNKKYTVIQDAFVAMLPPPPVDGLGTTGGFKLQLEDQAGLGYEALDEAKKRGELIPAEDVAREWADLIGRARAKLLGLPPRLAAHAMTCATVREAEEFARAEVYAALSELGETPDDDPAADSPGDADALAPAAA